MPDGATLPMTNFTPGPETARAYRNALGCFATGVTVITCRDSEGPLAITANSFASVSLDPALVLWSPAKTSKRYASFLNADHFAIHVLRSDQHDVAQNFARDGRAFDGVALEDWSAAPLLSDCMASFACQREAAHDAGDHTIIIGRVAQVAHKEGAPLLFAQGAYGRFQTGL